MLHDIVGEIAKLSVSVLQIVGINFAMGHSGGFLETAVGNSGGNNIQQGGFASP